jgi:antitoxin HicB
MTVTAQDEILATLRKIDAKFDRLLDALIARYEHGTPPPLPEVPPAELQYPVTVKRVPATAGYVGGYVALALDLPGCIAGGATPEGALARINREIETWIAAARTAGRPVPPPSP